MDEVTATPEAPKPLRKVTTVSCACLTLLQDEPQTASEMIAGMKRLGLRYLWPRAESRLYEEPHILCEQGLAEVVGSRERGRGTRYRITDAGREELLNWLARPGGGPSLEYEALLKVYCSGPGAREQVLLQLETMKEQVVRGYIRLMKTSAKLGGEGIDVPRKARSNAMLFDYSARELAMRAQWIFDAERYILDWPDEVPDAAEIAEIQQWFLAYHGETVDSIARIRSDQVPGSLRRLPGQLPDPET